MLVRYLFAAALLLAASAAAAQPALFTPSAAKAGDLTPRQTELLGALSTASGVEAVEIVRADAGALAATEVSVDALDLRVTLRAASAERRATGALSWAGTDADPGKTGAAKASAVLVARAGMITGTVWADGYVYDVRPLTGGLHAIARVAPEAYRDHDAGYDAFLQSEEERHTAEHALRHSEGGPPAPEAPAPDKARMPTVDVIVPYTTDVTANYADPVALAQAAIDATNTAYQNSGLALRVRLVHAYETPFASSNNTGTDLSNITGTADGTFDEVHGLRDAFGADMVALLGAQSGAYNGCGRGYLVSSASSAFTVTAPNCAVGNLTFAHELGHNFGAEHDAPNANNPPAYAAFGLGHVSLADRVRTTMAYNNQCSAQGFNCTRQALFSNPDVDYAGTTTASGDAASADNSRVHEERGATVAAFRAESTPPTLAYSPGSFSVALAPGGATSLTLTLENVGASGVADLDYSAEVASYSANTPAPGGAGVQCTNGQALAQTNFTSATTLSTSNEVAQSWTAPCTGVLKTISFGNFSSNTPGNVWSATMRVYGGEGITGAELGNEAFTYTNGSGGIETVTVPLSNAVSVTEGQSYTWYVDMTSGVTQHIFNSSGGLAGGTRYTVSGGVATDAGNDMNFANVFDPSAQWATLTSSSGSVAQGGSASVTVNLDAAGLTADTYTVDVVVTTNDPEAVAVTVPVTLIVGAATAAAETIDGGAGWRLFAPAAPGMTVADLGGLNRLSGIPGYDPFNDPDDGSNSIPNLFTGYDGTGLTAASGGSEQLELGEGFWWYLYDANCTSDDDCDGGSTNPSYALPFTLATPLAPTTADVDVTLHADDSKVNLLGNPFGQSLDLSGANAWAGASNLQVPVFAIYDSGTNSYSFSTSTPVVSAWQGFYAYGEIAGTLTIPASARTTGGTLRKDADERVFLALELAEATPLAPEAPLVDRGAVLYFSEDASAGEDAWDLAELAPLDARHLTLAFGAEEATGAAVLRGHEGRAPQDGPFELPVHVGAVGSSHDLVLTWPTLARLPADWGVTLVDEVEGVAVDLRTAPQYAFRVAPAAPEAAATWAPARSAAPVAKSAAEAPRRFTLRVTPAAVVSNETDAPVATTLALPQPNPVRSAATLRYSLAQAGPVTLAVYDARGREVARLAEGVQPAGDHAAEWQTDGLAAGVYVVRLVTEAGVLAHRAVVAR